LRLLGSEPDFLVLTESAQEAPMREKAPVGVLIMAGVLLPVLLGWLPISIAAVVGATVMILTGCLTMEEAYRFIEWKAVFLIAGMLPLGIAMEQTGAAQFLAERVVTTVGGFGALAVVASLFILAALTSQVMPNAAVAVLLAPIALSTATELGLSPHALLMTVALSASASFLSPVAHPANLLILGPGGYRFTDYIKVGLPLTLVVLATVLLVLPIFWPLVA
jgi:di/tricarboxylate transporter